MSHADTQLPPIVLGKSDSTRLGRLTDAAADAFPATAEFLARELARAAIAPDAELSDRVVRMGSTVAFREHGSDRQREVTLVYPEAADIAAAKISVLTPIGAALIGLSVGQTMEFQTPAGGRRSLTVMKVHHPV
jgi:regulator of nucleoside diphosphate kinase